MVIVVDPTPHPPPAGLLTRTRTSTLAGLVLLLVPLLLGAVVGGSGLGSIDPGAVPSTSAETLLRHNLVIAALAASGLVTFGLGTLLAMVPSWFLVGTQVGASVLTRGADATARGLVVHGLLELAGFVCASAIGLLPLVHTASRLATRHGAAPSLGRRLRDAAALALGAVALLSLAAVLETSLTPLLLTP
ncbi:MAG: stage II sporulation protein M [Actinomycetota bacterium]|nr:stage II sporulation protein M [Actinomycetota bacterium]